MTKCGRCLIIYEDLLLDWKNFKRDAETLISDATSVIQQAQKHSTLLPDEILEMELTILETRKLLSEKHRNLAHAVGRFVRSDRN